MNVGKDALLLLHSKTATRELEKSTEVHRYPACLCTKCSNHQPCLGIHSAGCYAQSILHMLGTDGMSCCCSSWYHACSTLFTLRGVRVEPERFSSDGTVCYAYHSMCMPIRLGVQPTGNILHCAPNPPPPCKEACICDICLTAHHRKYAGYSQH